MRMSGPKTEEAAGGWRKLNNEELHNLYCLPRSTSVKNTRRVSWAGYVAHMGENKCAYSVLAVKTDGKRSLGISRRR
jgi:hypothetical protein